MESEYQNFAVTDANGAVASIAYKMSDMCFIYPITPGINYNQFSKKLIIILLFLSFCYGRES